MECFEKSFPSQSAGCGMTNPDSNPSDGAAPSPSVAPIVGHDLNQVDRSPPGTADPGSVADGTAQLGPANVTDVELPRAESSNRASHRDTHPLHLVMSTLLSLVMVIGLLFAARLLVPPLVESVRYGWHRGQLRAEYEVSGQQLKNVSLDSLTSVSQLVSQRAGPSVVHINLLRDDETLDHFETLFGNAHPTLRLEGQGSGFVIDAQGHILTNHHVVDGVGQVEVTLSDGRQLRAEVVGVDPMTDLAVLRVAAVDLLPVEWGDSEQVVVGTPVWAVGSPFGLHQTVTFGIISGKHRVDFSGTPYSKSVPGGTAYGDLMQSDVALNPGNSGGPLVNSKGEVVGVNAAILGETYRGISFSIPSRVAQHVARKLIEQGEVPRGWLGVRMEDLALSERYDPQGRVIPGVRVRGFPKDATSPARDAGIQVGDIIVEFQQQPVMSQIDLTRMIGETDVGSSATIGVLREEERLDFQIKLGKRDLGF